VTTFSAAAAILLAAVIGFAIHRASLCNVRAVAEVLSSRRGFMLMSFFKTILWVIAITWMIDLIAPSSAIRPHQLWAFSPRALAGGFIIGIGVVLTPGGNDVLILHTIPSGSPHALPAYAALLVGTAFGLMVIRALVGNVPKIECTGDVCRIEPRQHRSAKSDTQDFIRDQGES